MSPAKKKAPMSKAKPAVKKKAPAKAPKPKAKPATPTPDAYEDFMAGAYAMEIEASDRYAEFADQMDAHNNAEVATFFRKLARIEALGYRRLAELGATPLQRVVSSGGGAANPAYARMRARLLGVPVERAAEHEACYGAARLARFGTALFPGERNE